VRELLAQGADIETRDEDGWTPLMLALAAYERYTAALLVELGANTHATTPDDRTVTMLAAEENLLDLLPADGLDVAAQDDEGDNALMFAANNGRDKAVRLLLKLGAPANTQNHDGWTALYHAASKGRAGCVAALLQGGADPNIAEFDFGMTPLQVAIATGHTECVLLLLEGGATVQRRDAAGKSPLYDAVDEGNAEATRLLLEAAPHMPQEMRDEALFNSAEEGKTECLRLLVQHGCSLHAVNDEGVHLLGWAAFHGRVECVAFLLQAGLPADAPDAHGHTALYHAKRANRTACARLLEENGAAPCTEPKKPGMLSRLYRSVTAGISATVADALADKGRDETPLMVAAARGNEAALIHLLKHGAAVEETNHFDWTALHYAVFHGHAGCAEILLRHASPIDHRDEDDFEDDDEEDEADDEPDTPLILAVQRGHAACLQLLLNYVEKDPELLNHLLRIAAKQGRTECIELLLQGGANMHSRDGNGMTPLLCAAAAGQCHTLRYLLSCGADLHTQESAQHRGALHLAAEGGHSPMVTLLLDLGLDINAMSLYYTPLMCAAAAGHADCVSLLLERGAKVTARDSERWTALHFAAGCSNPRCI
ncbi:MAG: ankyrin repeat domain-containing protein, partial [Akkermansia sp.]|nr:ankyrin repeat domain-containing protein [Akkermansia sp.]